MALPKLMHPTFELTVPSVKQKVKFRPFLVKEEKLLLMAKQSGEQADIVNVLKQVINNCDIESVLNIDQLASFDIEFLFLKLRAKSINNIIDLAYTDFEDDEVYKFQLDADEIQINFNQEHKNTIALSDTSGIVMKYPSMDLMSKVLENNDVSSWLFLMIKGCMDQYYEDDKIVMFKDSKPEEIDEFIDNLPTTVIKQFETFFDTMPKLYHKLEYTNKKGTDRVIELRTLEDFFTLR
jgi:hypothetical protein